MLLWRVLLGLVAGAALAYAGNALLFTAEPLRPGGASLLFVPLGVLLVAPFREAVAVLPLAFAVARLGCLPFGCCYAAWWGALPELLGYLALHAAARRFPGATAPIVLVGFGALRLLSLPWRAPASADGWLDPAWVAGAWIVAGFALRGRLRPAALARAWPAPRDEPWLRALGWMLGVWLLFPLSGWWLDDPTAATWLASLAATALLVARRERRPRPWLPAATALCAALLAGYAIGSAAAPAAHAADPALAAGLVLLAPVFEELLYRERLLGALRVRFGSPAALPASSALFALAHDDPAAWPFAFAGGLVCGAVWLRSGSLAAAIGLHAGWNLGVIA